MKRISLFLLIAVYLLVGSVSGQSSKVVVTGMSAEDVDSLRSAVPGLTIVRAEGDQLLSEVEEADVLIGTCDSEAIERGVDLEWVQVYSAGVRYCLNPELVERDIVLTNAKIIQGPEIADHAFALLLSLTRGIKTAVGRMEEGSWERSDYSVLELRGKTALIIGMGGIGTQVAERASAFGMDVLAVDAKDIPMMGAVRQVRPPDQLDRFLPLADVVFSCVPHTDESEGLLGARQFELMKEGSYLINVSRGRIVDTEALLETLQAGHLAGAGLDVTDPEPLPPDHPLWSMGNVVITPHIAGQSDQIGARRMALIRDNLLRFAEGLPLRNRVDKQKGY